MPPLNAHRIPKGNALEKEILTNSLPAKVNEVVAIIDKQLVSPATTLEAVANHPWLVGWIKNGEDPESLPLVLRPVVKLLQCTTP